MLHSYFFLKSICYFIVYFSLKGKHIELKEGVLPFFGALCINLTFGLLLCLYVAPSHVPFLKMWSALSAFMSIYVFVEMFWIIKWLGVPSSH